MGTKVPPSLLPRLTLAMFLHRLQISFHQTGDKWKHLPDLALALNTPDTKVLRSLLTMVAISSLSSRLRSDNITSRVLKSGLLVIICVEKLSISSSAQYAQLF